MTHFERFLQLGRSSSQVDSYFTATPAPTVPDLSQVLAISVGGVSQCDIFVRFANFFFLKEHHYVMDFSREL
jgi:hypothetical protein